MKELTNQELKNLGGYSGRGNSTSGNYASPTRYGRTELVGMSGRYATPQKYGRIIMAGNAGKKATKPSAMTLKKAKAVQVSTLQTIARLIDNKKAVPAKMVEQFVQARTIVWKSRGDKVDANNQKQWAGQVLRIIKAAGGKLDRPVKVSGFYGGAIGFYDGGIGFDPIGWVSKAAQFGVKHGIKLTEGTFRAGWGATKGLFTGGLKGAAKGAYKGMLRPWAGSKKKAPPRPPIQPQQFPYGSHQVPPGPRPRQMPLTRRPSLVYRPSQPLTPTPSIAAMARQIAERKAFSKAKEKDLASRLEVAQRRRQLAELERAEREKLEELEEKAAAAEAEAAMLEAEMKVMDEGEIGSYFPEDSPSAASILGKALDLRDKADQARIAKAVLKNAAPIAKGIFASTGLGKLFNVARNIYKDATKDPNAKKTIKKLKTAEAKGSKKAAEVMAVLRAGKAAETEVKAAKTVQKVLNKEVAEKRAKQAGVSGIGSMLPSNARVLSVVPGAKKIYLLAKQGNSTMLNLVKKAAETIRKMESGDAAAGTVISSLKVKAREGDKQAQMMMGALAVAAAGIREQRRLKREEMRKKELAWEKEHLKDLIKMEGDIEDPALKAEVRQTITKYKRALAEGAKALDSGNKSRKEAAARTLKATENEAVQKIKQLSDPGAQREATTLIKRYTEPLKHAVEELTGRKAYAEGLAVKLGKKG